MNKMLGTGFFRNCVRNAKDPLLRFNSLSRMGISPHDCVYRVLNLSYKLSPKVRHFHSTKANNIHPLLWTIIRPVAKLSAAIVGRGVRKWWSKLPQNKKELFIQSLNRQKYKILGVTLFIGGAGILYYETHLQEVPLIKRRRFIAFNPTQILELAEFEEKMLLESLYGEMYRKDHPMYKRVENVVNRIVNANSDISQIKENSWVITVIDSPVQNAFVLPNGRIFVYQGMLDMCINDDQLAIILSHELAHAVLSHGAEQISYLHLLDMFTIALVGLIWAVVPTDLISILVQWMMHRLIRLVAELPYSRQLEVEADEIGLTFLAKALSLMLACKCPPLPKEDPRHRKIVIQDQPKIITAL